MLTGKDVQIMLARRGPLIPGTNTQLSDNQWRITEVTYQGEAVDFAAIHPVYLTFDPAGEIVQTVINCNTIKHIINVTNDGNDGRYHLVPGHRTVKDCSEVINQQEARLTAAIGATTGLMVGAHQLLLTGEDVRIVLEIDTMP